MPTIALSRRAKQDLQAIWAYIANDKPRAADHTLDTINVRVHLLVENPKLGPLRTDIAPDLRYLVINNYLDSGSAFITRRSNDTVAGVAAKYPGSQSPKRMARCSEPRLTADALCPAISIRMERRKRNRIRDNRRMHSLRGWKRSADPIAKSPQRCGTQVGCGVRLSRSLAVFHRCCLNLGLCGRIFPTFERVDLVRSAAALIAAE